MSSPPRIAVALMSRLVPDDERDPIVGDLTETYADRVESGRRFNALWFWGQTLLFAVVGSRQPVSLQPRGRMNLNLGSNLRHGARRLRIEWRFTLAIVAILAIGIGPASAMMSVLNDTGGTAVLAEARRLNMDCIVEVHDERELQRALALGAAIVGINNRDLKTLTTDLSVTERLAPLVPANVLLISESGISSRADVGRLAPRADAFLVGSSLMAAPDIAEAARALVHGRVKLCGLTRAEDVQLAARSGATHAGFILVEESPRAVGFGEASRLACVAQKLGLKSVGVFRDCPPEAVRSTALMIGLDAVQLHGRESAADIAAIPAGLPQAVELWAACAVGGATEPARPGVDRILFDNGSGGTGRPFDWSLLKGHQGLRSAFLAGGVGPSNARAAAGIGVHGLDVGSSIEDRPGIKDPAKVEALFAALRPSARSDA